MLCINFIMSSAVAMNRKIAAQNQGSEGMGTYDYSPAQSRPQAPRITGTPTQQLWTVTNFHEKRLQRIDGAINETSKMTALMGHGLQQNRKSIEEYEQRISRLESELAALKQHIISSQRSNRNKKNGSVSLEVSDA